MTPFCHICALILQKYLIYGDTRLWMAGTSDSTWKQVQRALYSNVIAVWNVSSLLWIFNSTIAILKQSENSCPTPFPIINSTSRLVYDCPLHSSPCTVPAFLYNHNLYFSRQQTEMLKYFLFFNASKVLDTPDFPNPYCWTIQSTSYQQSPNIYGFMHKQIEFATLRLLNTE